VLDYCAVDDEFIGWCGFTFVGCCFFDYGLQDFILSVDLFNGGLSCMLYD
jgi:hypothetical protein